jgi:hypothetical protein
MRPTTSFALIALLALALLPRPGTAQLRFDGIDISGGYFGWESAGFQDVEGGPRFGVLPLLRLGDLWNVGVEGVYAKSEIQLVAIPVFLEENAVNAVVRRNFSDPSDVHVYLQGRGGWSRLEGEVSDGPAGAVNTRSQSGYSFGAEFGVGFPAGRYIDILWAGSLGWNSYTQCEAFSPGYPPVRFGDDCSAVRWGVRVGIVLGRSDG